MKMSDRFREIQVFLATWLVFPGVDAFRSQTRQLVFIALEQCRKVQRISGKDIGEIINFSVPDSWNYYVVGFRVAAARLRTP